MRTERRGRKNAVSYTKVNDGNIAIMALVAAIFIYALGLSLHK